MVENQSIRVFGARQHNLKNINVSIPRHALTVITGVSGSGKSSLAFDTLYAEGQRRYVESLSADARLFLQQMPKADVERIEGLCPTIAFDQRAALHSPRSTVATVTEIHDLLRLLFARTGEPKCWICGQRIRADSIARIVDTVLQETRDKRIMILAPLVHQRKGSHQAVLDRVVKEGFVRLRIDGEVTTADAMGPLSPEEPHTIELVVDRVKVGSGIEMRLAESLETAARWGRQRLVIATETESSLWSDRSFSTVLSCADHPDVRIESLEPQLFSFSSPRGACQSCHGLGTTSDFDPHLVIADDSLSLSDGAITAWRQHGPRLRQAYQDLVRAFCRQFGVLDSIPFKNLAPQLRHILLHGTDKKSSRDHSASFEGVLPNLQRRWEVTKSESLKQRLRGFMRDSSCSACAGQRLNRNALSVTIAGKNLADITGMSIATANDFFLSLDFDGETRTIAEPLLDTIRRRLALLVELGVEYLALNRSGASLSGGEWQRVRLATQLGTGLSGVCYVLDEPTAGLHPRDTKRLLEILNRLASLDNTVVAVEHDPAIMAEASHWIDIGPGAGEDGGKLVAQGRPEDVLDCDESLTAQYFNGNVQAWRTRESSTTSSDQGITLRGVSANNLKNLDLTFPLGRLVCVTGVSGSGKSTLVRDVLARAVQAELGRVGLRSLALRSIEGTSRVSSVIEVGASPIGKTSRSTPATYLGILHHVRSLFATTHQAKIRGYAPARFSFNVKGGRCEACRGQGEKRIAMHFLPDVFVTCDQCEGTRYNRETLDVRYRGKNIAEVLDLTVDQARRFFENIPQVSRRLAALEDVGLGYVTLGQPSNTLSGGEAQRIKLAERLMGRSDLLGSLYILDEPTTGLHFADVERLILLLHRLVDEGNSVVVTEHNLDVIRSADWIIDLGPEGGEGGGQIVTQGKPQEIALHPSSHTGRFLRNHE